MAAVGQLFVVSSDGSTIGRPVQQQYLTYVTDRRQTTDRQTGTTLCHKHDR